MGLDVAEKKEMIQTRREGPERHKYGAELDLKTAKAAGDTVSAENAQAQLDGANASLAALDAEFKSLDK